MSISRELKAVLKLPDRTEWETRLKELMREVGATSSGTYLGQRHKYDEAELVRRIHEAVRRQREHRLWIVALVSACASVVAALAAWPAVLVAGLSFR